MRGCQRQIIMLKGTDSQIFDEAYFLLRKDFEGKSRGEAEIIRRRSVLWIAIRPAAGAAVLSVRRCFRFFSGSFAALCSG